MKEEKTPMHKFEGLKNLLKRRGYVVDKARPWELVRNGEFIDLSDLTNGNITFNSDGGIQFKVDGGYIFGFLYRGEYDLRNKKPRMHICKCSTLITYIQNGTFRRCYRFAETDKVLVADKSDFNKVKEVSDLPLCQNCIRLLQKTRFRYVTGSRRYVNEIAKDNQETRDKIRSVDIFGYTKDWESISRAYRESKEYRCDKCGVQITNPFDYHLMHVHHKDGDKTNNKRTNLRCLCIECHSTINPAHRKRFSSRANQLLIEEFRRKYR